MTLVVVYNAGASTISDPSKREKFVLHRKPLKHAIGMLIRGVATPVEWVEGEQFGPYPRVTAVELVTYVFTEWVYSQTGRVLYSRDALMRRDRYKCAYCPRSANTVDHVFPKSRGGRTEWLNCVAACASCNGRKRDCTPRKRA